ncbi:MAG: alpha/beta fold hydrolase [Solirubrobacterales bacterium]
MSRPACVFRRNLLTLSSAAATCVLIVLAGSAAARTSPATIAPASFKPVACSEMTAHTAGVAGAADSVPGLEDARCAYLTVPEDRRRPASDRRIRLAVAIVPAVSPKPVADPLVFLAGGPGSSAMGQAQSLIEAGVNRDRDLILMEQRGALFSQPQLICSESASFVTRRVGLVYDALSTGRRQVAATRACRRRFAARGIDLGAYNTTENAADFAELRQALGIQQWNLFGVSYGTDLALTLMREHPAGIRTVTLDSVVPPQSIGPAVFWPSAREGFDNLFAACASQSRCRHGHPHLRRTFNGLVRKLESHPLTTRIRLEPGTAATKVVMDGGALADWLVLMALGPDVYVEVPSWIDQLAAGHPQNVAASWARLSQQPGNGLQYGVVCGEWVPYQPESEMLERSHRAFPSYPDSVLAQAPQIPFSYEECGAWNVPKAPAAQRQVTRSNIPTLLLSGTFDAVTPPSQARVAARTLSSSSVVSILGVGHGAQLRSPCANQVLASFLSTPGAPNTSCVAGLRPPTFR